MPATATWRAALCLAAILMATGGCRQAVLPQDGLRSGLAQADVIKLVGRKPERVERFVLKERPGEPYSVVEYYLARTKTAPEVRYWFLFDRGGLVGYGRGGSQAARGLAYDLYYQWLADHKIISRAEAEQGYLKQLKVLYGGSFNPLAAEYVMQRAQTMSLVDARKLPLAEAEAEILKAFSARLGAGQRAAIFSGTRGEIGRYATLSRIGLDVRRAATIDRRGAAAPSRLVSCDRLRAEGASNVRCF